MLIRKIRRQKTNGTEKLKKNVLDRVEHMCEKKKMLVTKISPF